MATITPQITYFGQENDNQNGAAVLVLWEGITDGDDCTPVEFIALPDRSVQIVGTFDSDTVVIQGSNDGATWATLTDPQGNAISKTSAALEQIAELTRKIRPNIAASAQAADINVYLLLGGPRR